VSERKIVNQEQNGQVYFFKYAEQKDDSFTLLCSECGSKTTIEPNTIKETIKAKYHFEPTFEALTIPGVCHACLQKKVDTAV